MAAFDEDDAPKKKIVHEMGQDLTLLSAGELTERIAMLRPRSRGWRPTSKRNRRRSRRPICSFKK